jgi:ABC-2 type transport system ATP-binding protein
MNMQSAIIETHKLSRKFGSKAAVCELDLSVPQGAIFAFLGPNGAGKTTTIKMLLNMLHPTSGEAKILGESVTQLRSEHYARIGYVSESQQLPVEMNLDALVRYLEPLYPTWDKSYLASLKDKFELPMNQKIKNLSRGMRMKAMLMISLAYRPELLLLDEPFGGLDPLVRDELIQGILDLTSQENWTIFLSSHDVDEVERLADWVAFLNEGTIKTADTLENLQNRYQRIEVVTENEVKPNANMPEQWLKIETNGRRCSFIDSLYESGKTETLIHSLLPNAVEIRNYPISLKEIYLAMARYGCLKTSK